MAPDKTLVVKLTDAEHRALRVRAAELDMTMSEIVRGLLQGWLSGAIDLPAGPSREDSKE